MIHSVVIVTYPTGGVIFSRFYGHNLRTELQQANWLKLVHDATKPCWSLLIEDNAEQVASIDEVQIVCKLIDSVVLILAGSNEHDALLMQELGRSMSICIKTACHIGESRTPAEQRILQRYADVCLIVDEQIDDGDIDHLDPRVVLRLIRMRPLR